MDSSRIGVIVIRIIMQEIFSQVMWVYHFSWYHITMLLIRWFYFSLNYLLNEFLDFFSVSRFLLVARIKWHNVDSSSFYIDSTNKGGRSNWQFNFSIPIYWIFPMRAMLSLCLACKYCYVVRLTCVLVFSPWIMRCKKSCPMRLVSIFSSGNISGRLRMDVFFLQ